MLPRFRRTARTATTNPRGAAARGLRTACAAAAGLLAAGGASAIDFGPFSLTGFANAEFTRVSNSCPGNNCQRDPLATKEFVWADELAQGKTYDTRTVHGTKVQPYLGAKFDLPRGFKLSGLLSQRWRDGKPDFKGFLYERNVAISHEDFGRLSLGAMPTRAWGMTDFPFASDAGASDAWASAGAGYGLLTRAVRYTSRVFDVAEGDLVVEGTYDIGKEGWSRNKPSFYEVWVHYGRGDLSLDAMFQQGKNGTPSAFGHGVFTSLFYDSRFDQDLGGSGQSIAMLLARYRVDARLELFGGLRGNRWSGAYAKLLQSKTVNPGGYDIWNNPFNVDWSVDLGDGVHKGYPATSVDFMLGTRYKLGKWAVTGAVVHLGAAATENPTDRGARNAATIGTLGLYYDLMKGVEVYGTLGAVNYARKGLAPLSMPSNSAFTNIDSRLTTYGNWFTLGATYKF